MATTPTGIDQLRSVYRTEIAALSRTLEGVSDEQWLRPSPCGEWDVLDLLTHLRLGTGVHTIMIRNALAGRLEPPFPSSPENADPRSRLKQIHADQRAKGAAANLAELREAAELYAQTLSEVDDAALDRPAWWWMGQATLRVVIGARVLDLVLHASDIRRALGLTPWFTPGHGELADATASSPAAGGFFQPALADGANGVIGLVLNGTEGQAVVSADGLTFGPAVDTTDAIVSTGYGTWSLLMWNRITLLDAETHGLLTVTGNRDLVAKTLGAMRTP